MRTLLLIFVFALTSAAPVSVFAAVVASLLLNPCGPQTLPPPCAAVQHALGQPVTFWVVARDAQFGLATNYTGTVTITSSDPSAVLPPPHAFTNSDGSVFAFTITFNSLASGAPSTQTVTATDVGNGLTTSAMFFVVPAQGSASVPTLSAPLQALLAILLVALAYPTLTHNSGRLTRCSTRTPRGRDFARPRGSPVNLVR